MHTLAARRLLPVFATDGCRRLLSSTRPTCFPRKNPDSDQALASNPRSADRDPRISSRQPVHKVGATIGYEQSDVRDRRILEGLLYPGTMQTVANYLPLKAAAEIVTTIQFITKEHPTPPQIVSEVLKIAEQAYHKSRRLPRSLVSIYQLAMSLARPGELPHSDNNGDLIARLLQIAKGKPGGTCDHYDEALVALVGSLRNRSGGEPICLADYSKVARTEFARDFPAGDMSMSVLQAMTGTRFRRESNSSRREALAKNYLEALQMTYRQSSRDSRPYASIEAALRLGESYAIGDIFTRDGQLARLWWERALCLGWKAGIIYHRQVRTASYYLARVYLGQQLATWGDLPLFAPDFSRGFQYVRLAKWEDSDAAIFLASLYYLDPQSEHCKTVGEHISLYGVVPDDTLAAEAFYIGAERLQNPLCKYKFAEMLQLGRAHPPVDATVVTRSSFAFKLPPPAEAATTPANEWSIEQLEMALERYDGEPVIEFAPRSRRETLEYAWSIVRPIVDLRFDRQPILHPEDPLRQLPDQIREERKSAGWGQPIATPLRK